MAEEIVEWRDAWKKLIDTSRISIINKSIAPFDELHTLQNDKMLLFEKAIALECIGKKEEARRLYKEASDEKTGLPVEHWRKRAQYFLERLDRGGFLTDDLNTNQAVYNVQWDLYFNIHSYAYLDDYIRYLAISSVSRIGTEPAMAIVIFRTCLEIGLWTYFEKEVNEINIRYKEKQRRNSKDKKKEPKDIGLNDLLDEMNEKYPIFQSNEYTSYHRIRIAGNDAAHPKRVSEDVMDQVPFKYTNDQLIYIMNYFNQTMRYLNKRAKHANTIKS